MQGGIRVSSKTRDITSKSCRSTYGSSFVIFVKVVTKSKVLRKEVLIAKDTMLKILM